MMASAAISARASPANACRTLWITERSATIAPTPIAMQRKKNSSRRQDDRISRPIIAGDEHHRAAHQRRGRVSLTERPSRSVSRASASAAMLASCVTSTSVTLRRAPHLQQQIEDVAAVGAVEVAGGLVGEDERRIVGQRARDGHALLLAARQLRRIVMAAVVRGRLRRAAPGRGPRASLRPAISIGTRMFSSAVSDGTRWKNWKTKPIFAPRSAASASSSSAVMSVPPISDLARASARRARRSGRAASTCRCPTAR